MCTDRKFLKDQFCLVINLCKSYLFYIFFLFCLNTFSTAGVSKCWSIYHSIATHEAQAPVQALALVFNPFFEMFPFQPPEEIRKLRFSDVFSEIKREHWEERVKRAEYY